MREDNEERGEYNEAAYWKRKQSVKENRVSGEAPLAGADRDAESKHYNWKGEGPKDVKSSTIWEDSSWRDKEST